MALYEEIADGPDLLTLHHTEVHSRSQIVTKWNSNNSVFSVLVEKLANATDIMDMVNRWNEAVDVRGHGHLRVKQDAKISHCRRRFD